MPSKLNYTESSYEAQAFASMAGLRMAILGCCGITALGSRAFAPPQVKAAFCLNLHTEVTGARRGDWILIQRPRGGISDAQVYRNVEPIGGLFTSDISTLGLGW
ncbi:hypothetical protein CI102_12680 [Trichoderma harzianum]|nr:hypothetical protein CI102_12680 [Trichoderma harzianum]